MSDVEFKARCRRLGFLSNTTAGCLALHQVCSNAGACWSGVDAKHRPKPDRDEAQIFRPWVGRHYAKTRLLVLGLNMNGWGGYDAFYSNAGVPLVRKELASRN